MIGVIDVPWGNRGSLEKALLKIGLPFFRVEGPSDIESSDALILPGVGHFSALSEFLDQGWRPFLQHYKRPFLGICLGMHSLFKESEESSGNGLGIFKERIRFLNVTPSPHMGWNNLEGKDSYLLKGLMNEDFYFAHSYGLGPLNGALSVTTIDGVKICSSIKRDNFYGVQFHPEKSGEAGYQLLRNFYDLSSDRCL